MAQSRGKFGFIIVLILLEWLVGWSTEERATSPVDLQMENRWIDECDGAFH